MPNLKISAMPGLGIGAAPGDLLTVVDVSAPAATANKKETLNNLLSVITRGITDRTLRFQAPASSPPLSVAGEGGIHYSGSEFLVSVNGGAWTGIVAKGAVTASGLTMGGLRLLGRVSSSTGAIESIVLGTGLAWTPGTLNVSGPVTTSGLTATSAVLLGRTSAGVGPIEEIVLGANVGAWISNPTSSNLLGAITDPTGTGQVVFGSDPTITGPRVNFVRDTSSGTRVLQFVNTGGGSATNYLEAVSSIAAAPPVLRAAGSVASNIDLQLQSKGNGNVRLIGSEIQAVNPDSTLPGILSARGGSNLFGGGQLRLYERTTNGSHWVGFEAPDSLASDLFWTLPATDGTAGQALVTDGGAGLSWATPSVTGPITLSGLTASSGVLLGRTSPGIGAIEEITPAANVLTWITTPSSQNLRNAVTDETGAGLLVFNQNPLFSNTNNTAIRTTTTINATGTFQGNSFATDVNTSTSSTSTCFGLTNTARTVAGSADYGTINALQNEASHNGPGSIGFLNANNTVCFNRSNASVVNAVGGSYTVQIPSPATGIIDNARGITAQVVRGAGTINNGIGVLVASVSATNRATGLQINSISTISGTNVYGVFVSGAFVNVSDGGSTQWATASDIRYKNDIVDYEKGLAQIMQYRPVRFTWNAKSPAAGKRKVGLIAQEAMITDSELVITLPPDDHHTDRLGIDTENITWQLVRAVQELAARVVALETMEN